MAVMRVTWKTRLLSGPLTGDYTDDSNQPPPTTITKDMFPRLKPLSFVMATFAHVGDRGMYCVQTKDLGYPKPVSRGSADSFVKPPANLASQPNSGTEDVCTAVEEPIIGEPQDKPTSVKHDNSSSKDNDDEVDDADDDDGDGNEDDTVDKVVNAAHDDNDISCNASSKTKDREHKAGPQSHTKKKRSRLIPRRRVPRPIPLEAGESVCVQTTHNATSVNVMWQDGTLENGIASTELVPIHHLDELEFFPGDFVTRNKESLENEYGLVCRMERKERTCMVQWIACPNQQLNVPKLLHTEELSVYDVSPHADFDFKVGSIVLRADDGRHGRGLLEEYPYAGEVRWVESNGQINIAWVDGSKSSVYPQDILIVHMSDSESEEDDDDNEPVMNAGTIPGIFDYSSSGWEDVSGSSGSSLGSSDDDMYHKGKRMDKITVKIAFGQSSKTVQGEQPKTTAIDTAASPINESDNLDAQAEGRLPGQVVGDDSTEVANRNSQESCPEASSATAAVTGTTDADNNVPLVDGVAASHHSKPTSEALPPEDPCTDRLMPQISSLLPGILIKGFEDRKVRMVETESIPPELLKKIYDNRKDLYMVLLEGPNGSPYQNGLFIFSIIPPPDYPDSPPFVCYHPYCSGRLNPNIYEDGRVCISVRLGQDRDLLQVLVALRGLFLTSEPYYSAEGYMNQLGSPVGAENCRLYNEMVVLKTVQSMTQMLSEPPAVYHNEILQYCYQYGFKMIKQIEHWLALSSMATVLSENQPGVSLPPFPLLPVSKGFVVSMEQALSGYRAALRVAGIADPIPDPVPDPVASSTVV